ncbi:glycosyltransferase [Dermacoccus sp. PE3]|uniref:glycosyltransferase n=1 Tax=Dermacoccus sp. PE3 TaxID=1641401 RepID=UPI0012E0B9FE|nr:glycosyltransferase [Dermacoccus sp. PE3]
MPLVPLAQQLQLDGHSVLFATTGPASEAARRAGVGTVDAGGRLDARAPYDRLLQTLADGNAGKETLDEDALTVHGRLFGEVGLRMLDDLVDIGRHWGADAVVYPGIHSAALVAARQLGATAVLHGYGSPLPTFTPALDHILRERSDLPDSLSEAQVEIDVFPPSLVNHAEMPWDNGRPEHRFTMRYGSYNGASDVPMWVLEKSSTSPRIVLTCGSTDALARRGETYRRIIEALDGTDCEIVVLSGGVKLDRLPEPLPANVRVEQWLPLSLLLEHSDAILHHGGSGTVLTSLAAGIPQVGIPMPGTVNMSNMQSVVARRAGTTVDLDDLDSTDLADAVRTALADPALRGAAENVRDEMAAMPSTHAVAAQLSEVIQA